MNKHTHIHSWDNYRSPRCTCVPRVNKFVLPIAIQSASCITSVDINIQNQRQNDDLMLGTPLMEYMRESENELLDTTDLANFN